MGCCSSKKNKNKKTKAYVKRENSDEELQPCCLPCFPCVCHRRVKKTKKVKKIARQQNKKELELVMA